MGSVAVDADQRSVGRIAHHLFGGGTFDTKMLKPVAADDSQIGVTAKLITFPEVGSALFAAPERGRRNIWFIGIGVLALMLAAITAAWWSFGGRGMSQYTIMPVSRGAIVRMATGSGTVNPELTIIVGSYVSGVIQQLYCDYNTVVKKGQLCAKIDPRPFQTVVDQCKANLSVAQAQLEKDRAALMYAKLGFDRANQLVKTNAVSQDAFDIAKSTYDQAHTQILLDEATIEQRQAELATAQVNLDYTNITSPVDGVVVSRSVTIGQTVAAAYQTPTLFLIATDLAKMEVDTNVSESDVGDLKDGDAATFKVDAFPRRTFEGVVSQIRQSPQTVQNVVTYDVVISAENPDLALMPGMTADAQIVTDHRDDVIRVPNAALRYAPSSVHIRSSESQVWVLHNNKPMAIPVIVGLNDDRFTQIVGGNLKPGDLVITGEQDVTNERVPAPQLQF